VAAPGVAAPAVAGVVVVALPRVAAPAFASGDGAVRPVVAAAVVFRFLVHAWDERNVRASARERDFADFCRDPADRTIQVARAIRGRCQNASQPGFSAHIPGGTLPSTVRRARRDPAAPDQPPPRAYTAAWSL